MYLNSSLRASLGGDGGGTGIASFAYAIGQDHTFYTIGVRTGFNVNYNRILHRLSSGTDSYTALERSGAAWSYTTTASNIRYVSNAITFDIPLTLTWYFDHIYFDVGARFVFPIWSGYKQSFDSPEIKAESPDHQTFVNDPRTGVVSSDQYSLRGTEKTSAMQIGFTFAFGSVFRVVNSHRLGFELFLDVIPFRIGGDTSLKNRHLIDVSQVSSTGEPPLVTVNPLWQCHDFHKIELKTGVKLVYCFDIEHPKKLKPGEEQQILLTH